MSSRIVEIPVESMTPEQRLAYEKLLSGPRGRLSTPYKIWLNQAPLALAMEQTGSYLLHGSSLSRREIELAVLIIAQHFRGEYVFRAHTREGLDAGIPQKAIDAIESGRLPDAADPRERSISEVTTALCREQKVAQPVFDAACASLGHKGIADLLALLGYYTSVAMAMKMYDLPPVRPLYVPLRE